MLGLLGPGPVEPQVAHGHHLAAALGDFTGRFLDLGSGGGVPGLVLAVAWPRARGTLLDSRRKAWAALEAAVAVLDLAPRIEVVCARAEILARAPAYREQFDLVVARAFGSPAVTAESAVGFLAPAGRLVVTEPPTPQPGRWPEAQLAALGFGPAQPRPGYVEISRTGARVESWPRSRPTKSPLW
ncbi:MAG: RsmG family class I SAM-dependent methyltransferase [Candidatus Rokuibacteriota bacterium]